jgi:hypothetical protein
MQKCSFSQPISCDRVTVVFVNLRNNLEGLSAELLSEFPYETAWHANCRRSFDDDFRLLDAQPPLLLGKVSLPRSVACVLRGVDLIKGRHAKGLDKSPR